MHKSLLHIFFLLIISPNLSLTLLMFLFADDPQLDAQVPTQVSYSEGQRPPETALQHLQDIRIP